MTEALKAGDTVEITQGGLYKGVTGTLRRSEYTPTGMGQVKIWEVLIAGFSLPLWVAESLLRRVEVTP